MKSTILIAASAGCALGQMLPLPTPRNQFCRTAIAFTYPASTNRECMALCDSLAGTQATVASNSDFSKNCRFEHYTPTEGWGRVRPDGECFSNWIFGYSEPFTAGAYNDIVFETDSPAICQAACQDDPNCANWTWVSQVPWTDNFKCFLKSEEQLRMAMNQSTAAGSNINTRWCNSQMNAQCPTGHYECRPCVDDDLRCVWRSDNHISGWKGCVATNVCSWVGSEEVEDGPGGVILPTSSPTTTTTTTTPTTTTKPTTTEATLKPTTTGEMTVGPTVPTSTPPGSSSTTTSVKDTEPSIIPPVSSTSSETSGPTLPSESRPEEEYPTDKEGKDNGPLLVGVASAAAGAAVLGGAGVAYSLLGSGPPSIDAEFAGEADVADTYGTQEQHAENLEEDFA